MKEFDFAAAHARWDRSAADEEAWTRRPSINRSLRWREVLRHLADVRTVLDVGAGTGAFSIPLAERGYDVTHLDFSTAMLTIARQKAQHCPTWQAVEANAIDLSQFANGSFDLVLVMDGAISGSGCHAEDVLREGCRVTRRTIIVSVAHRAFVEPARLRGELTDELRDFTAPELRRLLEAQGLVPRRVGGIGSLATLCGREYVQGQLGDAAALERFLDHCEAFDRDVLPDGPGTMDDTGLLAAAERSTT